MLYHYSVQQLVKRKQMQKFVLDTSHYGMTEENFFNM